MNPMTDNTFGAVPEGMRWCSHCNGYGSSLKESSGRCSHCAGTGLVVDEATALAAEGGNGSPARPPRER
jgi:DnaJ-class molecular chaperone